MRIPGVAALVFVLMVIFMIMLAFIMRPKGKSTLRWLGVYAVIVVGYIGYVCYTCGPNPFDIKVMKPMAEAISNYIVKHGVPESLSDIPDLPYELEGCSKDGNDEKCYFKKDSSYIVRLYAPITGELTVELFSNNNRTGIQYWFTIDNKKVVLTSKGDGYSSKTDGICNPMRQ